MTFSRRFAALACAGGLGLAAGAGVCLAHGGPPLRLGVTAEAAVLATGRLALVHLREGVGFAVEWREFEDQAALRAAFAAGRLDIAVVLTRADPAAAAAADCPRATLERLGEELSRSWQAAVFLLQGPSGPEGCGRPALIVSRGVLDDPRFGILGKEAARLAAATTRQDLAAVSGAQERGGERAATAAARAALAAKAGR